MGAPKWVILTPEWVHLGCALLQNHMRIYFFRYKKEQERCYINVPALLKVVYELQLYRRWGLDRAFYPWYKGIPFMDGRFLGDFFLKIFLYTNLYHLIRIPDNPIRSSTFLLL